MNAKKTLIQTAICLIFVVTFSHACEGAVVVDIGNHPIMAATNQTINVTVSSDPADPQVTGYNLNVQIGDGLGVIAEPTITSVDFLSGTLWTPHSSTVSGGPLPGNEQFAQTNITFNNAGDQVEANGLLLSMTLDASGFAPGQVFTIQMNGTQIGTDSSFILNGGGELVPTFINGSITIMAVPEPSSVLFFFVMAGSVLIRKRR